MTDEEFVKFLAMQDFFEHLVQNRKTSYTTYRCPRDCEHNYYRLVNVVQSDTRISYYVPLQNFHLLL